MVTRTFTMEKYGSHLNQMIKMYCISFLLLLWKITTNLWLKITQMYYLPVLQPRSLTDTHFTRLKSWCWQGKFLSGGSRGESVSLPFPVSKGYLYSLAHGSLPPSGPQSQLKPVESSSDHKSLGH